MSGLLACYTTLRKMEKINISARTFTEKFRFWLAYISNRYFRTVPMMLVLAFFLWFIHPTLSRGPNSIFTAPSLSWGCRLDFLSRIYLNFLIKSNYWYYLLGMFFNMSPTGEDGANFQCAGWVWYIVKVKNRDRDIFELFKFYVLFPYY